MTIHRPNQTPGFQTRAIHPAHPKYAKVAVQPRNVADARKLPADASCPNGLDAEWLAGACHAA